MLWFIHCSVINHKLFCMTNYVKALKTMFCKIFSIWLLRCEQILIWWERFNLEKINIIRFRECNSKTEVGGSPFIQLIHV